MPCMELEGNLYLSSFFHNKYVYYIVVSWIPYIMLTFTIGECIMYGDVCFILCWIYIN